MHFNDTSGLIFDSNLSVRQGSRIIGRITEISNSECVIVAGDIKKMTLARYEKDEHMNEQTKSTFAAHDNTERYYRSI